ncbi:MAG: ribonuclease P [Methanocorpusculum parvum]|nr:ribonuclease P [Methanocorpusculum parvum]
MAKSEKGVPVKQIARERIEILFSLVHDKQDNPELADRYVSLAREISMRQRLRLSKQQKRSFCRSCGAHFVPGRNLRVRVQHGKVIYTCQECGNVVRIPVRKNTNQVR